MASIRQRRAGLAGLLVVLGGHAGAARADTLFVMSNDIVPRWNLLRFDLPSNVPTNIAEGPGAYEGIAVSPSYQVYVCDTMTNRMDRYNADGSGKTNILPAAGAILNAEGPCFDAAGNLYFNTRDNLFGGPGHTGTYRLAGGNPGNAATRILAPFSTFGEGTTIVRGGPHAGALLVTDASGTRILISEPPGAPAVPFIAPAGAPVGLTTSPGGDVYVSGGTRVLRFDPGGMLIETYLDVPGSGLGFLDLDSTGDLYVSDFRGERVIRVRPDRTYSTFAAVPQPVGLTIWHGRPLRVTWGSFEARWVGTPGQTVEVTWQTLEERNTTAFEVERAPQPLGPFATVGIVEAVGEGHTYRLAVAAAPGDASWYRVVEHTSGGRGDQTPSFSAGARPTPAGSSTRKRRRE